jgi:hypothetical protein
MKVAVVVAMGLALFTGAAAHAEACFKSGEETGGTGKVCHYRCTFGETTRNVGSAQLCPINAEASPSNPGPRQLSGICFKTGELSSGMTKACVYDCTGTRKVMTINAAQLCPLNPN